MPPSTAIARVIGLLTLGLLAACTQPTPYAPADGSDGYREQQLAPNRYRVIVSGNRLTPREQVADYLLYRAAELTQAGGGTAFTVITRDIEKRTSYRRIGTRPVYSPCTGCFDACWPCGYFDDVTVHPEVRYRASAEILVHTDSPTRPGPDTYTAAEIRDRLAERVEPLRPQPEATP